MDKVVDLQEYKQALEDKKKLDSNDITLDYLDLNEIENVKKLYVEEINRIDEHIKELEKENKILINKID